MDLFTQNYSDKKLLKTLIQKYKDHFHFEFNLPPDKTKLVSGSTEHYGNVFLFIFPNVTEDGFLKNRYEKEFIKHLEINNIEKYIICYAQPSISKSINKKLVKQSKQLMYELIDLVIPKMIVCVTDQVTDLFINTKIEITEINGSIFFNYREIPVSVVYDMEFIDKLKTKAIEYSKKAYSNTFNFLKYQYKNLIK